jgi:hypothetical protein
MSIEFGLGQGSFNTKYAPLAAIAVRFQQQQRLKPLENVAFDLKEVDFSGVDKLTQLVVSMLAGCEYISEVNSKLKCEEALAEVWQFKRFAEQSTLARTLDELSLTNLSQLEQAVRQIWHQHSHTRQHDWRGFLELDLDLSGLPCGQQAQGAEKGYFSGKKTLRGVNWPGSVPALIEKHSGQSCSVALVPVWLAYNRLS